MDLCWWARGGLAGYHTRQFAVGLAANDRGLLWVIPGPSSPIRSTPRIMPQSQAVP
jgi:hypothetical protein